MPLDRVEAAKALLLTAAVLVLFLTSVPAWLTALGAAGVVLSSRKLRTRSVLGLVDWQLLVLFVSLFVVVRGFEISGHAARAAAALAATGANLSAPAVLVPVVAVLSNLVSNVPAVMLLLPFVEHAPHVGHLLALSSTFAGNAVLMGSIANLIVAEQAGRLGLRFGFREHLRVGLPVTLAWLATVALAAWMR